MAATLKMQKELWLEQHGTPMTELQEQENVDRMLCLQGLYFEDAEAIGLYSSKEYWEDISEGALTLTLDPSEWKIKFNASQTTTAPATTATTATATATATTTTSANHTTTQLNEEGFAVIPNPTIPSTHPIFAAIKNTAQRLAERGWPPGFILIYDQVWELIIAPLWSVYTPILGQDAWMEPDLNCWRLMSENKVVTETKSSTTPPTTPTTPNYIGVNFGKSHRDMTYEACHDVATEAFESLNCWVPINPTGATLKNGCMHVIPIEHDDYFYDSKHPYHMSTAKAIGFMEDPKECTTLLPAPAGSVVTWTPSLVHWGGACEAGDKDPRMSIAATFRKNKTKRSVYGDGGGGGGGGDESGDGGSDESSNNGPPPIQFNDISDVCVSRRLSYISKGIISFAHWYPGFPGLSVERLKAGSRQHGRFDKS